MTEIFRIVGLNNINFDEGTTGPYRLIKEKPPQGLSNVLTRNEVLQTLPRLPLGIRPQALAKGLSVITFEFNIQGATDPLMEQYRHDLTETLEDAALYIETRGGRGTRGQLRIKANLAVENSYKTIFYGAVDELQARDVLGPKIRGHFLEEMRLTLYCEPYWRPDSAVELGPNEIKNPSFERDGNADGLADNWTALGAPVLWMDNTPVNGCYDQGINSDAGSEGVMSAGMVVPAGVTTVVAYAWIYRSAGTSDIVVQLWDATLPGGRGLSLLSAGGWQTKVVNGNTWYRVVVTSNAMVPTNTCMLQVFSLGIDPTWFFVDMTFWKWGTTICPDEWIDHYGLFTHHDPAYNYPNHIDHINYLDVDDLKGDVDARLLMRVEFEQQADLADALDLIVGRRTQPIICNFVHWLEGEHGAPINWPVVGPLARCSNASRLQMVGVNTTGNVLWDIGAIYGNLPDFLSSFDIFAIVKTDDKDNTQYRAYSRLQYGPWCKQAANNKWQMIYLGSIHLDRFLRAGIAPLSLTIGVAYKKDPADTVELDAIWLIPRDEPEFRLDTPSVEQVAVGNWWVVDATEDWDYDGLERTTPDWVVGLNISGGPMTLKPRDENRLYFVCLTLDVQDKVYEAHGAATDLQMIVSLSYLPQYVSPLE